MVLATLLIMFILYYFLAKDEERRMVKQYGDSYKEYMSKTGMFFPMIRGNKSRLHPSVNLFNAKNVFALVSLMALVIGAGFILSISNIKFTPT